MEGARREAIGRCLLKTAALKNYAGMLMNVFLRPLDKAFERVTNVAYCYDARAHTSA